MFNQYIIYLEFWKNPVGRLYYKCAQVLRLFFHYRDVTLDFIVLHLSEFI